MHVPLFGSVANTGVGGSTGSCPACLLGGGGTDGPEWGWASRGRVSKCGGSWLWLRRGLPSGPWGEPTWVKEGTTIELESRDPLPKKQPDKTEAPPPQVNVRFRSSTTQNMLILRNVSGVDLKFKFNWTSVFLFPESGNPSRGSPGKKVKGKDKE